MRQREPRITSAKHLRFIRGVPCCICGNPVQTEAAHVRYGEQEIVKPQTGIATKPDDIYVVPLCGEHHRSQHKFGDERAWWAVMKRDPIMVAQALWICSGDQEKAERIALARL